MKPEVRAEEHFTAVGEKLFFWYYALTPLFVLLDLLFAANIRVVALEHLGWWKWIYYLFCLGVAAVDYYRPSMTRVLGLIESCLNIFLLVLSVALPVFLLPEKLLRGETVSLPFDGFFFLNFFLAGAIFVISFYGNLFALTTVGKGHTSR